MTPLERRQQLHHQIDQLSDDQLEQIQRYLDSLSIQQHFSENEPSSPPEEKKNLAAIVSEIKQRPSRTIPPAIRQGSTAQDLLKYAGTWEGDDLEACLQFVHETRSKTKF